MSTLTWSIFPSADLNELLDIGNFGRHDGRLILRSSVELKNSTPGPRCRSIEPQTWRVWPDCVGLRLGLGIGGTLTYGRNWLCGWSALSGAYRIASELGNRLVLDRRQLLGRGNLSVSFAFYHFYLTGRLYSNRDLIFHYSVTHKPKD